MSTQISAIQRRGGMVISVESPISEEVEERDSRYGVGRGLSEVDFMMRQRYLENSR